MLISKSFHRHWVLQCKILLEDDKSTMAVTVTLGCPVQIKDITSRWIHIFGDIIKSVETKCNARLDRIQAQVEDLSASAADEADVLCSPSSSSSAELGGPWIQIH